MRKKVVMLIFVYATTQNDPLTQLLLTTDYRGTAKQTARIYHTTKFNTNR